MESTPEQAAEGLAVVQVLAAVLERLVCANTPIARADPGQVTKFHALKAPGIGILQYLERIHKYASCSSECFIMALIYIDRLIQRNNFLLTELNVHRVVITAILLAAKFFDDAYYNNAYYAKVGGVLVSEMNGLEVDFLFRINFSLHVTPELFEKYRAELLSHSVGAALPIQPPELAQSTVSVTLRYPPASEPVHATSSNVVSGPVSVNYATNEAMPLPSHAQITPSPPRVSVRTSAPLHVSTVTAEDMIVSDPVQSSLQASDIHLFSQSVGVNSYLQRANSCPVPKKPSIETICHPPHPFSAPPMVAMVHGGLHVPSRNELNDPYVMLDNQIFPLHGTLVHHHHGVDVADLLRHGAVQSGYHQHNHGEAYLNRDGAAGQRFVHGGMLAGVSGGM